MPDLSGLAFCFYSKTNKQVVPAVVLQKQYRKSLVAVKSEWCNHSLVQQIVNKEFNFAPFFLSTALISFAVAKAMPVKLALYKEKNEAKYTTHYLQIAALVSWDYKYSSAG